MSELVERLQAAVGDAYRVERELTRGGMSRLFLATETSLNREVVIKLLPPEWASDVSAERFRREVQVAAHLQHPNVLPVLAAGVSDGLIYYVMPYVRGESLRHRLVTDGKLPLPDALRFLREVADALAYAHAHGVVHRDIKPENILLQQGHAVLTDFGVARAVAEARTGGRLTETGMVVGTPGYMSPEQAAGDSHIDARADVYALAVVGYEMLTGSPPFTGPTAQAVIAAHLTETAQPVERLRPDTPRPVADTITRALAKNPLERLQTAAAFRDTLARASGATVRAAPPARRWLAVGAAAAALVVAALALWPKGYRVAGDPRHSLIIFPFDNRTGDAEYDWLQDAAMNSMGLTMAHWEDLRVYDDERTLSLMRREAIEDAGALDFAAAQRLAREARVGTLVLGDIRREAETLVFEAKVHDVASGNRLSTEIVRAPLVSDPRFAFDSLSARILRVSGAPPGERPGVVAQTTRSVEAYRAYLTGSAFVQQLQVDSAERYLERAIALDTTFALAYVQLRNAEGWKAGGSPERRRALIAKAEQHAANLPPRLRSLVQVHVAYESGQFRQARATAEQMIARDSTDIEAWYQLGEGHFHHGATRFPHPDTLGNLGKALAAFQRVLALDSSYTIAYRHTADILELCALSSVTWVCLPDSTAYGPPDQLERRYGDARLGELHERARAQLAPTIRAWTAATPASPQVRERAIEILIGQGMVNEAQSHLDALRGLTGQLAPLVEAAEARILLAQRRYPEAADRLASALARASPAELANGPQFQLSALSAAGRLKEAEAAGHRLIDAAPASVPFPGNVTLGELRGTIRVAMTGVSVALRPGTGDSVLRAYQGAVNDSLRRLVRGDTTRLRQIAQWMIPFFFGPVIVATLDTSLGVLDGDPPLYLVPDAPVFTALGALGRGDSAAARRAADAGFPAAHHVPATAEQFAWLYMWGQVSARLGDPEHAVQAYAMLDSTPPGSARLDDFYVRSWAERGALYQALGDTRRAIEMYEKFIEAWRDADPDLQPLVERARGAVAAMKGEVVPQGRR